MGKFNRNERWNKNYVQQVVLITQREKEEGLRKQVRKENRKNSNI